ncbi:MAG: hypothetical protein ACYS0C_06435 [Planctomycetota bacterium]|jgi:probable HAF family extracellular repeat protein
MRTKSVFVLAMVVIVLAASSARPDVLYDIIDLGTLTGGNRSLASSINNRGQIVGRADDASNRTHATLFDPTGNGHNTDLGTLSGGDSMALSINNTGQIVGHAFVAMTDYHAVLFDSTGGGQNIDLGTLGGNRSNASSINNNGQIVGQAYPAAGKRHATLFDPTGQGNNINLGTLGGDTTSFASSINDKGQIVGSSAIDNYQDFHATLFDPTGDGNNIGLGTLYGYFNSGAKAINNNGQIVGAVWQDLFEWWTFCAVLFDPTSSGGNIDLGGGSSSAAYSINNNGQIVGWAGRCVGGLCGQHAALFDPNGQGNNIYLNDLIDPNLGWELKVAECINDKGWIVGSGINPAGETHAFLLKPILPAIEAEIDIKPNTLNLHSKGKWLSCHIRLGEEYDVADVNSYSVFLEDEIGAEWIWFNEQQQAVMVRFSRAEVQDMLEPGQVELTVSGELIDGTKFEGTDTIKVTDKGKKK